MWRSHFDHDYSGKINNDVEGAIGEDDGQHVGQDDEPAAVTRRLLVQNIQSNIMHLTIISLKTSEKLSFFF